MLMVQLVFSARVNDVLTEIIRVNGANSQTAFLQPIDMSGNAITTGTGNITLSATASTGTGDILLTPKVSTGSVIVSKDIITDSKITNTGLISSSVDFTGSTPDLRFNIDANKTEHYWYDTSDTSVLTLDNDYISKNNVVSQVYTTGAGAVLQTGIQTIPTSHRLTMSNNNTLFSNQLDTTKLLIDDTANNKSITIDNNISADQNRITLFKNQGGGIYEQSGIINNTTTQTLYLSHTDNSVYKSLSFEKWCW